jgi:hypothetical protein
MLNNSAYQKLSTIKPDSMDDANIMIIALITSRNNPKVRIVMGMVSITNTGLTTTFRSDKTIAASRAVIKESTATPGNR